MARAARPADGEATLAAGAVVTAHVLARILGLRLLRLEATVVVTPPGGSPSYDGGTASYDSGSASYALARRGDRPQVVRGTVVHRDGGLREAERLLREARAALTAPARD